MYEKIFVSTFDSIFKNFNNLFQKLLIPILLIIIIDYFFINSLNTSSISALKEGNFNFNQLITIFLISFLLMMLNISIAITTHRVSILGNNAVSNYGSPILGKREFKFLLKSIQLCFIIAIPTILLSLIPTVGIFIAIGVAVILSSRLSLVFPAIACDYNMSFKQSWNITKRYKLLTFVMIIIFPIIFSLSVSFVYNLAIGFLVKVVSEYFSIFYSLLNIFIMIFTISVISSVYKYINNIPLNNIKKEKDEEVNEIIESSDKNFQKIEIKNFKNISFESLKNELYSQCKKINFCEIVFDRRNAWIIKNPEDEESYLSLRYDKNIYTIIAKNCSIPRINILKK
ncbi:hypothetical protein [Halarcobacter sp.]|uniref:hypothetical protein n=1 Tax=Halarcobacter sp. TaxID=2321133 RepID=UPI002AAC0E93|nr:hypothetical protein [Halarcobacter sp.]